LRAGVRHIAIIKSTSREVTVETTKGNCGTCTFWAKAEKGTPGWNMNMGRCTNVPKYHDAGEDSGSNNPDEWGESAYVLKPEFKDVKALALDGSGYRAELLTTPDFGCVSYAVRE
jgi:hypothetical protein